VPDRRSFDCSGSIEQTHREGANGAKLLIELHGEPPVEVGDELVVNDPHGWRAYGQTIIAGPVQTGDEQSIIMSLEIAEHVSLATADELRVGTQPAQG
jgi:hypothetical protein